MANCTECLYYEVCRDFADFATGTPCVRFTDKSHYAEVVRCGECKYCEEAHYEEEGEKPYIKLKCKWSNYSHAPNDYCSCGERRE